MKPPGEYFDSPGGFCKWCYNTLFYIFSFFMHIKAFLKAISIVKSLLLLDFSTQQPQKTTRIPIIFIDNLLSITTFKTFYY
jgi:hypothetical protein